MVQIRRKDQTHRHWGTGLGNRERGQRKDGTWEDLDMYMTSEGRKIDWGSSGEIRDGRMIEVGLRMKGGGMKKKTKTGNHWKSLASGGESEGSQETEKSERDETEEDIMLRMS